MLVLYFWYTPTILCKGRKKEVSDATHIQVPPQAHKSPTNNDCGSFRSVSQAIQLPTGVKDLGGGSPREHLLTPAL
jgi:hypothetical protein